MGQIYVSSKSGKDPKWVQRKHQGSEASQVVVHEEIPAGEEDQF